MKLEQVYEAFINAYYKTDGEYTHEEFQANLDEIGLQLTREETRKLADDIAREGIVVVSEKENK